jgi:hypothetical protein
MAEVIFLCRPPSPGEFRVAGAPRFILKANNSLMVTNDTRTLCCFWSTRVETEAQQPLYEAAWDVALSIEQQSKSA